VSQNNNIKRITSNLLSIRSTYGTKLGTYDEKDYYRFPSLDQLAQGTVAQLREMGLGYRAEYIKDCTARL
jgi:N-glycosylase/DNA lyase